MGRTKVQLMESMNLIESQVEMLRAGRLKVVTDGGHMREAFEASKSCIAEEDKKIPTPFVCAVLVKHGRLLGTAYRGEIGPGEHADYTLLERKLKEEDLTGASTVSG